MSVKGGSSGRRLAGPRGAASIRLGGLLSLVLKPWGIDERGLNGVGRLIQLRVSGKLTNDEFEREFEFLLDDHPLPDLLRCVWIQLEGECEQGLPRVRYADESCGLTPGAMGQRG